MAPINGQMSIQDFLAGKGKKRKAPAPSSSRPTKRVKTVSKAKPASKKAAAVKKPASGKFMFHQIVVFFEQLEATTKRLEKRKILTRMFLSAYSATDGRSALQASSLLTIGKIRARFKPGPSELGIGESSTGSMISKAFSVKTSNLKKMYQDIGDYGQIAAKLREKQRYFTKAKPLTVCEVVKTFREIAEVSGKDSMSRKGHLVLRMFSNSSPLEVKYITRMLSGKMRTGIQMKTVVESLGRFCAALSLTPLDSGEEDRAGWVQRAVERVGLGRNEKMVVSTVQSVLAAFNRNPDISAISRVAIQGPEAAGAVRLTLGCPALPMLAKAADGIDAILKRMTGRRFACEYKYDGFRCQVHWQRGEEGKAPRSWLFSRSADDMTAQFPDVIEAATDALFPGSSVTSFVLDGEVVALGDKGQILPFQKVSKRLKSASSTPGTEPVCYFAFDLLHLNGEELLSETLARRRALLTEHFEVHPGAFQLSSSRVCTSEEEVGAFLNEAVEARTEGLIVKDLDGEDSHYQLDQRSTAWLKLKKDYIDGLGDSFDLVPIAGWIGKGKRTGMIGAYLMACFEPDTGQFQTMCRMGTGFSEEVLETLSKLFEAHKLPRKPSNYKVLDTGKVPDFWLSTGAGEVWEVRAANISISPTHTACFGEFEEGKGVALRLPRLMRRREDKLVEDCTTSLQVMDAFSLQPDRK
eukprot:gnl/Dysnectes_brevis/2763_a3366_781.p1 GENE.gnl/Dysnectes_brevis/2763_a3366_781~~gnl/Dysnectes_brevis/2763_a3366_781.p1  ORF type:complete len:694 (+),score=239.42 gnl/Dysnectes_brevis/2763_a3366_781:90-2171(+)